MAETTSRFRASSDVAARDIPDGLMLVNVQSGAAYKLNRVGADVWKRLDGTRQVIEIVRELDRHYEVGLEVLVRDVATLLEELQKQGLVESA
jgi:coenzyme PQQ synthesis protein D (PqqD)